MKALCWYGTKEDGCIIAETIRTTEKGTRAQAGGWGYRAKNEMKTRTES